jgi:hypothetical protein
LTNLTILPASIAFVLHFCPISPCFQPIAPMNAALPSSLAEKLQTFKITIRRLADLQAFLKAGMQHCVLCSAEGR